MNSWISSALFLALSSPFATAQSIVFQDGFENGFAQWTATGQWNQQLSTDPCGSQAAPFPEGNAAAWWGTPATCNFDNGQTGGQLSLNTWVTLPSNVGSASLYFQSFVDSEYCWQGWDNCAVIVTASGGTPMSSTQMLCANNGPIASQLPWHERRIDLSAYRGFDVRVAFSFWPGDISINDGLGWLVDNVRIVTEPGTTLCPTTNPASGCPCHPQIGVGGGCFNALGKSATLMSSGVASVAQDSLAFAAAEMPPGTAATLFQGSANLAPQAFGDGLFCVTGSLIRLGTRFAPTGGIDWPVPNTTSISALGLVSPAGGDYFYQAIYRDSTPTHCTSATFNLTSAQRVAWSP